MPSKEKTTLDLSSLIKYIASALHYELGVSEQESLACAKKLMEEYVPALLEVIVHTNKLPQEIIEMCDTLLNLIKKYK